MMQETKESKQSSDYGKDYSARENKLSSVFDVVVLALHVLNHRVVIEGDGEDQHQNSTKQNEKRQGEDSDDGPVGLETEFSSLEFALSFRN